MYDERIFNARVIGTDNITDLAVLKIEYNSSNFNNVVNSDNKDPNT
ncbi:MAG: hypothetical protein ACM3VV_02045 [Deltaproteobacteria bacterium]|nr:hypothetical protein [Nitrososphaeraceae archaeon]